MKTRKVRLIGAWVTDGTYRQFKAAARRDRRTVSHLLRTVINAYIDNSKKEK